ncbi:acetylpolyamine amidohydrolase, partial [candidate division KSB3 bacterium]|nr:acetylpolyamine amidohydrolase [candidate division KSB3 bacterium]MBD3326022.1 acetylpolyamine amidohydrolase [candidate division KSB3 bacterium]
MLRIYRVYDDVLPIHQAAIRQVQEILRTHFSDIADREIQKLPQQLQNPLKYRFRSLLFVAEGARKQVQGFALVMHEPNVRFCFLDFLASAPGKT